MRTVAKPCYKCSYFREHMKLRAKKKKKSGFFFKLLIFMVVIHGMICVSMSYALAWMDHMQVVEGVSTTIVTEIIAPIIVYGFTKTVENIFQKNELSFSKPINRGQTKNITSAGAEESEELG